ncbi:intraflagellar transport protein 74 homolog [Takifugu flavidus]|uniref:intraflagellar transport protein 74 homolog n=1 Tax=Takifugu flavidus TaxID=433684 RepID=UPI0025446C83|nr:intraflagellar transport protein 74 homolog [Takifugu flavidus]
MDLLVKRKEDYEAELAHNSDKSEMLTLYKELTAKWETLQAGRKAQDPQGMEPLIKKMEKDSKELASIEKQLADLRDKENEMKHRIHPFRDYMKEYDMLKMREEKLDQLLESVEIAKAAEQRKSKTYYLGLLQEKNQDIAAEISKLENHITKFSIDEADYLHVVEQNKTLAHDIKDLETNLELLKKKDILQEEMDLLVKRKEDYEAELAHNSDKSEMLTLYKELTAKWETLQAGRKAQDPQGMEPLIKKMEKDSKELASIEKQLADLRDKENEMKHRIHPFRDYMKEYDMLKMREEKLDQLLESVEIAKAAEQEKIPHIQGKIASLSKRCNSYVRNCCMDSETAEKLKKMMTLVVSNSTKAIQSESSARRLAPEIELLRQDLKRVHAWKSKVCRDLSSLKEQSSIVESELGTHRTQRRSARKSEKKLHEEYELLTKRQRYFRQKGNELMMVESPCSYKVLQFYNRNHDMIKKQYGPTQRFQRE